MPDGSILLREIDRRIYEEEITPWLPDQIIDCHVHVGLGEGSKPLSEERLKGMWVLEVGCHQSWNQHRDVYRKLFPDQEVSVLAFANVYHEINTDIENDYIYQGIMDSRNRACGLYVTRPETCVSDIADAISRGFKGIKPYPDLIDGISSEVSIYDFLPKDHLKVINDLQGIVMMHLPRAGRLGDPNNIREIIEICQNYPRLKFILAHIGRAYCLPTAQRGLPHVADLDNLYVDTSANLNAEVFQYTLETMGADRVLFGTDIPGMLLRGVREHDGEKYINYTDGPYSWNTNRKSPSEEAKYTFYVYEEIRALTKALKRAGLGKEEMKQIMYTNMASMLGLPVETRKSISVS